MKAGKVGKSPKVTRLARKAAEVFSNTNGNGNSESEDHAALGAISHDEIRIRAYELFLARQGSHGDDWRDWFIAEQELAAETRRKHQTAGARK